MAKGTTSVPISANEAFYLNQGHKVEVQTISGFQVGQKIELEIMGPSSRGGIRGEIISVVENGNRATIVIKKPNSSGPNTPAKTYRNT